MLKKIKSAWNKLRGRKENELKIYQNSPSPYVMTSIAPSNVITLSGADREIFSIDANGNAIWHEEDSYDEAAEIFLNALQWKIEDAAGIQENRVDWEKKICEKLIAESEKRGGSLTSEELTEVVKKCIMYDRLKGKYGDG